MPLTAIDKTEVRQRIARIATRKGVAVHWLKSQINAAMDAIDARWDAVGTQSAVNLDIETAAPGVFTTAEKRFLRTAWLIHRGNQEERDL